MSRMEGYCYCCGRVRRVIVTTVVGKGTPIGLCDPCDEKRKGKV